MLIPDITVKIVKDLPMNRIARRMVKVLSPAFKFIVLALSLETHAFAQDRLELQSCLNAEYANVIKNMPQNQSNAELFKHGYSRGFDIIAPYENELRGIASPQEIVPKMLEIATAAGTRMADNLSQSQIDRKLFECRDRRSRKNIETNRTSAVKGDQVGYSLRSVAAERFPRQLLELLEPKSLATPVSCKVLDADLLAFYSGECQAGMASGHGLARGRDEYIGQFKSGHPHGFGIYKWGASSKWATEEHIGWHYKGKRTGFGILSVGATSNHPALDSLKNFGSEADGRYFASGLFKDGYFVKHCVTEDVCLSGVGTIDFSELSDAIKFGADSLSLDDVRRLVAMSVYRQIESSKKNECLIDELMIENLGAAGGRRAVTKDELSVFFKKLIDKSATTRAELYCS